MDLAFAKERMTIAYLEAEQDGLELNKLDMMLRFIDECDALMQEGAAGPEILPEQAAAAGGETPELEAASLPGMETPMTETITPPAMPPAPEGLPV